ncbi:hypothetical protein DAETH_38550 (plasmid) [Deinococcus aetherius]|uniref:Transcriptional regulator, AbiEi antitoxin, Type IV TA system n=1 Tax=Deinococcus aetherius TaxID=200252 RepID=A0ABN6RQ46_9DEIO|nr:type IV toxin-antitoxin system AbiEi family antitoxin domain-containing protein [Deinococcus aetherius]BDP43886.1 hypothetical protein DAETH_38550 [Deinococcus aetherius]
MRAKSTTEVQQFVERQPEGAPFSPTELLLYGTRASIDRALSRLTKDGVIERVARGIYVKPKRSRIVGKVLPSPVAVARTYARARGIPVTTPGAQVLADYGLSTQTPVTPVLSAGVSGKKTLKIGNRQVTLRHAPRYVLRQAGTPAGDALAALHHLSRHRPDEGHAVLAQLDVATFDRLLELRPTLPGWLADLITTHARGAVYPGSVRP